MNECRYRIYEVIQSRLEKDAELARMEKEGGVKLAYLDDAILTRLGPALAAAGVSVDEAKAERGAERDEIWLQQSEPQNPKVRHIWQLSPAQRDRIVSLKRKGANMGQITKEISCTLAVAFTVINQSYAELLAANHLGQAHLGHVDAVRHDLNSKHEVFQAEAISDDDLEYFQEEMAL